MSILSFTISD